MKTARNDGDVDAFLASVEPEGRRADARALRELMQEVTDSTGKACLYVKRLSDVDPAVLRELVERSVAQGRERDLGGPGKATA